MLPNDHPTEPGLDPPRTDGHWCVFFRKDARTRWAPVRKCSWRDVPVNYQGKLIQAEMFTVQLARSADEFMLIDDEATALSMARHWLPRLRLYYPKCGLQVAYALSVNEGLLP